MCPISNSCELYFVTTKGHEWRAVCFLILRDNRVTAKSAFDVLNKKSENMLCARFDHWVDGNINDNWYHGWPKTAFGGKYKKPFVFRLRVNRLNLRFYGFLCNPNPSNRRYQICVLVSNAYKKKYETDETDLEGVEFVRRMPVVQSSIQNSFRRVS